MSFALCHRSSSSWPVHEVVSKRQEGRSLDVEMCNCQCVDDVQHCRSDFAKSRVLSFNGGGCLRSQPPIHVSCLLVEHVSCVGQLHTTSLRSDEKSDDECQIWSHTSQYKMGKRKSRDCAGGAQITT